MKPRTTTRTTSGDVLDGAGATPDGDTLAMDGVVVGVVAGEAGGKRLEGGE